MKPLDVNLAALDERYGRLRVSDRRRELQLLASIEEHGQQDAICVVAESGGHFVVVDGHKRVRALRRLGRDTVRAIVWELTSAEALAASYRAASRQSYNAIEDGWLIYELHRVGKWDLGKSAAAMGRSKSWASRRLGLVETLPDGVLERVRRGELGAWSAMKHLLPLARANAPACERLAGKIAEASLSSRQAALVCENFSKSGARVRERILEDPALFLKALAAAGEGTEDLALSEAENRALKALELLGNVALSLTRDLPRVLGYDAGEGARAKVWSAWTRAGKRLALLEETAAALRAAREKNTARGSAQCQARLGNNFAPGREAGHAQPGSTDGHLDAAQAGSRQPQDRQGLESGPQRGQGCDQERPGAGAAQDRAAAQA